MPAGFVGLLDWTGLPAGQRLAMPNPLTVLAPSAKVSLSREVINSNFAARHAVGLTELTEADDGYVVLGDDEALIFTITADTGAVLPDPSTCVARSIYVFVTTNGGFDVNLTAAGGANLNGSATLTLSTAWAGVRLVARAADWIAL